MSRFAEAIEKSGVDVVPKITMGSSAASNTSSHSTGGNGGILETLLGMLLSEKMGLKLDTTNHVKNPDAEEMKKKIKEEMTKNK